MHDNHLKVYEPVQGTTAGHYVSGRVPVSAPGSYTSAGDGVASPGGYVSTPARPGIGSYTTMEF
jgi:hypothetical protein